MMPLEPQKTAETVMIICAHPDDEIIGVGGTAAKYAKEGKRVIAVIYSYGEGGNWWLKEEHTVEMRTRESQIAGKVVGIMKTIFLGLKDLSLKQEVEKPEVLDRLEEIIKYYSPSKIFTHSMDDIVYSDHKAVHDSLLKVLRRINYKKDVYTFNIWGKDIRTSEMPKLFVDVSETFKQKIRALKEFKSQRLLVMWQLMPGIYFSALKTGLQNKCLFAEKFVKLNIYDKK